MGPWSRIKKKLENPHWIKKEQKGPKFTEKKKKKLRSLYWVCSNDVKPKKTPAEKTV